jgi:hypothetical protein
LEKLFFQIKSRNIYIQARRENEKEWVMPNGTYYMNAIRRINEDRVRPGRLSSDSGFILLPKVKRICLYV